MKNPKVTPRPYQVECLDAVSKTVESGVKRALVVMASGLGKTLTSAFAIERFFAGRDFGRVLVLCHSEAILSQSKDKLKSYFGEEYSYGMFTGHERAVRRTDFLFATFQTMKEHRKEFAKDLFSYIVVDEAHHSHARTYFPTIKYFEPEFLLGLTATPDRLDGQNIEEIYGTPVYELGFVEAMSRGLLAECDYQLVLDDMSQEKLDECLESDERVSITQLNRTVFAPKRDEEIVKLIKQYSAEQEDSKTMIFCKTIEHARRITRLMGEETALVHTRQGNLTNDMTLEAFRQGRIRTIVSVQMLNEGVDVPDANVIVFLRNTVSENIFYQQLGRGTRLSPGKAKVKVLDFVGNCERIQMILELKQNIEGFRAQTVVDSVSPHGTGEADSREKFTLNIATPEFKVRDIDILALLAKACAYFYSDEALIKDYYNKALELGGRGPTQSEIDADPKMATATTYRNRFKTLENVAKLAGVPYVGYYYNDEELLQKLRDKAEREGKTTLTKRDLLSDESMPNPDTYSKRFHGFGNALKLAGLEYSFIEPYSDEELIELYVKKSIQTNGEAPTTTEVEEDPDTPSICTYLAHFKSWENLRKKSGLKRRAKDWVHATDQEILDALIAKTEKDGRTPTAKDIGLDSSLPNFDLIVKRFKSYDNALKLAGLVKSPRKKPIRSTERAELTNERLIEAAANIVRTNRRPLIQSDLDSAMSIAGYSAYRRRFGGMKAINDAVGTERILAELQNDS